MADPTKYSLRYYACLMRIWREDDSLPWRVQLQHVSAGEPLLFPDLLAAVAFIEAQLAEKDSRDPFSPLFSEGASQ